jgi:hypothetical protein
MPTQCELYGLPEYFIDEVRCEPVEGTGLMRIFCGAKKRDSITWLYTCVMTVEKLVAVNREIAQAAFECLAENRHRKINDSARMN